MDPDNNKSARKCGFVFEIKTAFATKITVLQTVQLQFNVVMVMAGKIPKLRNYGQ
jgi:hypothetical protein